MLPTEIKRLGKSSFGRTLKKRSKRKRYSFEFKSRAVSLYLEEGYPANFVAEEMGVSDALLYKWASTSTVHATLSKANLTTPPKVKPKRNPGKPRFFERATPNQLWQSDICTFRLGGKNACLPGFIDDYSRYITGLGLYRSQTAENLLEVSCLAMGEYGVPKEMLTDNGRQYTNWRGTTGLSGS